ncbi:SNO glutamine amidotransferase [Suillus decipiens]|nr:SNO glutamine amidotransferase [Suillus decipiens]
MTHVQVSNNVNIGILALQGAFAEHQSALQKLSCQKKITVILVRTAEDLSVCGALIIPGGESTTIALLAELAGLLEPLRTFLQEKPVWGTCAGAILLAQAVENTKKGGQELLGGISVTVARNGWGSQVESFEAPLLIDGLQDPTTPFMGVFIRAPVVLALHPSTESSPIEIIARLPINHLPKSQKLVHNEGHSGPQSIVALRQGRHMLTTFHPELTKDDRFHKYFVQTCVLPTLL